MSDGSNGVELRLLGDKWVMTGDTYALHRADLAIPFGERLPNGAMSWPATEETAVELMWFKGRFPYHCRHEMVLRSAAAKYNLRMIETKKVLSGKYVPGSVQFRDGLEPREYQKTAAMLWRTSKNLLCADELGLGKTISALAGLADESMLPAVVVCPSNLTYQWRSQAERFLPSLSTHIISRQRTYDLRIVAVCERCEEAANGASAALRRCRFCKHSNFKRSYADIYMVSYTLAQFWAKELGQVIKSVIYDECQEVRRMDSLKYSACKDISKRAMFRLGLSATPVFNFGGEMWNILNVVVPGRLGDKSSFRETWCGAPLGPGKEPPLNAPEAFSQYLINNGMMIRRTRKEIRRELPEEQRVVHEIDSDAALFAKMTRDAKELARVIMKMTNAQINAGGEFTATGKFRQMLYKATGVAKAAYVAQFVRLLLDQGEPVMLFGFHIDVYEIWCRELRQFNPIMYMGDQNAKQKEHNKQAFMAGESNLLICSLKSGVGLDGIQDRCRIGVFGELDWSPAVISQAIGRYHRDGQSEPCLSYLMISNEGCDPYMVQTLGIKQLQVDGVVQHKHEGNVMDSIDTAAHLRALAQKFLAA